MAVYLRYMDYVYAEKKEICFDDVLKDVDFKLGFFFDKTILKGEKQILILNENWAERLNGLLNTKIKIEKTTYKINNHNAPNLCGFREDYEYVIV